MRSRHTIDHYRDYLAPLSRPGEAGILPATPVLRVPSGAAERATQALAGAGIGPTDNFIVVHPGTARTEKYWVPERWAAIITFCQEELGWRCVLTGGQHDPEEQVHLRVVRDALRVSRHSCADLAGQLDLSTLTAVLARARLVLSVDNGPMHLAAAFERPQIVLFGPTNPFHWRPRHPHALVLRAEYGDTPLREFFERGPSTPMDQISTQAVIDCIKRVISSPTPGKESAVFPPC